MDLIPDLMLDPLPNVIPGLDLIPNPVLDLNPCLKPGPILLLLLPELLVVHINSLT